MATIKIQSYAFEINADSGDDDSFGDGIKVDFYNYGSKMEHHYYTQVAQDRRLDHGEKLGSI